ncbi:MAG: OmpA family protein [Myxococcota bacterium]
MAALLSAPMAANASPEITVGAAGGVMVTDPLEVLGPAWYVTPRVGYFFDKNLGLEADLGVQGGKTRIGEHPYMAYSPRVNLIGRLWNKGKRNSDGTFGDPPPIHPILAVGLGVWYKSTDDGGALGSQYVPHDIDFLANAGPGLMVPIGPAHLRTDLRWVLSLGGENYQNRGDQFVNWEWSAGLGFSFGGDKDKDKDGILDADDSCVDEAEDMDGFEDSDGCPELDNDNDGVPDTADQCANDPEDDDDFKDDDGCPDPDNDEDGVLDGEDECPLVAGAKSAKGCPDADGDSIVDEEDECPDEAGSLEAFGCPDDDEDKVPNYRDQCPDEPGPSAADPRRSDGCPARVFVTAKAIQITEKVFFDTGKATIKKESFPLLDDVGATLTKFPGIKKVSIEGHTDNVGDAAKNKKLSEDRAASVRTYLIEKAKIEEGRLESTGFGMDKPLVDGEEANTDAGRAQNRRVEFNILEQELPKTVLKRPTVELKKAEEGDVDVKGLVPKNTPVPTAGFVSQDAVCSSKIVISEEGKVTKVRTSECVGLARLATDKTLVAWEFEPYEADGKPVRVSTTFTVTFKGGKATVKHEAKNLKVLEAE